MGQTNSKRHDVIFAGVGGMGVLTIGEIMARAALDEYEHVVWFPFYGAAQRLGPSQCFVILSDNNIAAPYMRKSETIVALEQTQCKLFEDWVRPGGMMITESLGFSENLERTDVTLLKVPSIETAMRVGDKRASNFVLLGAYVGATQCVSPHLIEKQLEDKFGKAEKVFVPNRDAFRQGLALAAG